MLQFSQSSLNKSEAYINKKNVPAEYIRMPTITQKLYVEYIKVVFGFLISSKKYKSVRMIERMYSIVIE